MKKLPASRTDPPEQTSQPLHSKKPMNTTLNQTTSQPEAAQSAATRVNYLTPLANILETNDGYVLEAEMPGVTKDGLEITVENGGLTIVGHRAPVETRGREMYRESRAFDFRRSFELDPSIDTAKITAKIDQGLLTLHLPKVESVKPRKITVS
jgi:HSP20 family protein